MQNRADEAIVQLERAARRSDDAQIETLLVVALAAIARGDEALDRLRRAIARRPPFPPAFLEYASQLGKIGRVDEAIAVLESGLALTPMRSICERSLGISISNATAAPRRAIFSQLLAAAPERYDVLVGLAKVMALDGEYAAAADLIGVR
jgi:tetratricopeptide (TPR) repeat protein